MKIIAEIGQNHNGEMSLAFELIHAAKESGADTAKFQLYDARDLFPKEGNEWFEYNCKTEISRDQLSQLVEACEKIGIEFMASVFDVKRVSWLEAVRVKQYKIASRSINDHDLIQAIAETAKPMLVSLGMWDKEEPPDLKVSVPVFFLYCISKYPTPLSELEFSKIDFNQKYAGFSDHTIGITAAVVAISRGAQVLEKHFTLDKSMEGPDHQGSMTPDELKQINQYRQEIEQCL